MDLYSMQLNETMWINSNRTEVLRVAGGWIYRVFDSQTQRECVSQCFVPFNNEFQSDKPADRSEGDDYRTPPSSVRLNTEIICDQAEQIDNLKAEVERLRGDGWISVKERLPEKNAGVIIYTPHGGVDTRALGMCDDDPNGLWYCCKGADEPLRFNEVTHWRPLPEPPRGENGENNEI